jgi:hypothetical protein
MDWLEKILNTALIKRMWIFWGYGSFLFLVSIFMILKTKAIYISVWTHDNFTYLDGAYRILKGQIPHVDFITPIGLFGYLLPFFGLEIAGSYSLALPVSDLIATALIIFLAIIVSRNRLYVFPGLLLITYVWLLASVPINAGDTARYISYSMFYNRYGWALLLILFVLYVGSQEADKASGIFDTIAGTIILVFLFYTKISYFAMAAAFLAMLAFKSKYHVKIAAICFLNLIVIILIMELIFPGLNFGYFTDLMTALRSSGAIRGGLYTAINFLYRNLADIILVFFIVALSARINAMNWLDYVFVAYVFLATYTLLNQNAQTRNMVTLFAVFVWAMQISLAKLSEAVKNGANEHIKTVKVVVYGVVALSLLLVVQPFATRIYGMAIIYARSKPMPENKAINLAKLSKVYVYKDANYLSGIDKDRYSNQETYLLRKRIRRDWLAEQEYIETVMDGVNLLRTHLKPKDSVIVMDMVNPFNFLLDKRPPKNSYSFLHLHRTFNLGAARPKPSMLDYANLVMIPNYPIQMPERNALLKIFGPALKNKYEEVGRDRYWTLLRLMDEIQRPQK